MYVFLGTVQNMHGGIILTTCTLESLYGMLEMEQRSGEMIRAKMEEMAMKAVELERRTGWTAPNFSAWIHGRTIPSDTIARATCRILGIDFAEMKPILRRERFQKKLHSLCRKFSDVLPDEIDIPE